MIAKLLMKYFYILLLLTFTSCKRESSSNDPLTSSIRIEPDQLTELIGYDVGDMLTDHKVYYMILPESAAKDICTRLKQSHDDDFWYIVSIGSDDFEIAWRLLEHKSHSEGIFIIKIPKKHQLIQSPPYDFRQSKKSGWLKNRQKMRSEYDNQNSSSNNTHPINQAEVSILFNNATHYRGTANIHINNKSNELIIIFNNIESIRSISEKFHEKSITLKIDAAGSFPTTLSKVIENGCMILPLNDEDMLKINALQIFKSQKIKKLPNESLNPKPDPPKHLPPFHW